MIPAANLIRREAGKMIYAADVPVYTKAVIVFCLVRSGIIAGYPLTVFLCVNSEKGQKVTLAPEIYKHSK